MRKQECGRDGQNGHREDFPDPSVCDGGEPEGRFEHAPRVFRPTVQQPLPSLQVTAMPCGSRVIVAMFFLIKREAFLFIC
jgi:hypothetical protein